MQPLDATFTPHGVFAAHLADRIFVNGMTGCWEWTGPLDRDGYGKVYDVWTRRAGRIHRFAFEGYYGIAPHVDATGKRLVVAHRCGNRACCNPRHLECITQSANVKWSWAAGRYRRRRPAKRLTNPEVEYIRRSIYPQRRLAAIFGVSQGYVSELRAGKKRAVRP